MAATSSSRSSAELFAETPRHLRDVRETSEGGREGDRDGESFDDDAHDAGVPPKSPASPTRRSDRAAAAAAALTRDTPLEEGVYVSEPHFAPPRMDESQAWFHGDLRGGEDRDPASLFSRSLAVAPSPSSTRQSPPSSGGFVPSPAERRAAALALERSQSAPDENAGEEEAGARERTQPEDITTERGETTPEPTVLRDADDEEGHEETEEEEDEEEEEDAHVECDASVARRDEEVSDADDADDADDAPRDVEDFAARDATSVDAAFLAALMAEAEADAEQDARGVFADAEQDARGVFADDCDASPLPSPPRPLRSDPAERTRMPAAASRERASRETTSPRASLDAEEGAFSDSSAPMTASPKPARSLPSPPSRSPPRKHHEDDDDDVLAARDSEEKGRAGARFPEISFEDTLERRVSNPPNAVTKPSERRGVERRGSSPPPASAPLATPRAVSARVAMETRRVTTERERAEAARLFKARREEAGREALRRYFAAGERGGVGSSETAKGPAEPRQPRPGAPRTPLRLKRDPRDAKTAVATETTRSVSSPLRREAASLLSGERRRADLSATAAAAQAAKAAVFEAALAAAAAAKPSLSDRRDADENDDASPSATSSRKPTDVAAVPRVATLDDASRLAEARDALAAVAAAERAADSVERLTRAAAAAASRREARPAGADGGAGSEGVEAPSDADFFSRDGFDFDFDARAMPARRAPRPPLPAVASFEPEQRSHVPRAEAEAARERAQAEALAAIKARAAAARAEAAAAKAALDAEKAENAAAERAARAAFQARSSIEEAFPSWFGEPEPGFATGAAALGEVSPANTSPDDSARIRRDALLASPSPLPLARPKSSRSDWPASPPPPPPSASAAPASASPPLEHKTPPRKKGEAMWIDVGAWGDAAAAGVPSGGWGDAQTRAQRRRDVGVKRQAAFSGVFGSETATCDFETANAIGLATANDPTANDGEENCAFREAPSGAFHAQQRSLASLAAARNLSSRAKSVSDRPARFHKSASPASSTVAAYKAASRFSNRKLIRNALSHVCLAGAAMKEAREKCLQALDDVPPERASTFVIAFRDDVAPHRFRALYALVKDSSGDESSKGDRLSKIYGAAGPATVAPSGVESTLKYDSGTREFKPLATSAVGPQTAAVVLAKR